MLKTNNELMKHLNAIFTVFTASQGDIRPHFILTGPSGSGKTWLVNYLCDAHSIRVLEVNAAQLTKEGTAGNSVSKVLTPLLHSGSNLNVVFVDEWDKLFISGNSNSQAAHETTVGVQSEFLKIVESRTTSVYNDYGKYADAPVDRTLFIFAGAFNGEENIGIDRLREIGVKTEFLGRVGLTFSTQKLSKEDLLQLLEDSPLLIKYLKLYTDVKKRDVVKVVGEYLLEAYELDTLGARSVNSLIHRYFIHGGKLTKETVKRTSFQKELKF